jgi:20S proteasome subunit beta 4
MDFLLAIKGKDFVLTLADTTVARSAVIMKNNVDKSAQLNAHNLLLFAGESGDTEDFVQLMERNVRYYGFKTGLELAPGPVSGFIRRSMADSLRTRVIATSSE